MRGAGGAGAVAVGVAIGVVGVVGVVVVVVAAAAENFDKHIDPVSLPSHPISIHGKNFRR